MCTHRTLCLIRGTGSALGKWRILLNYEFPRLGTSLTVVWRAKLEGLVWFESLDLCSPSRVTANVLKPSNVVLTNEKLLEGLGNRSTSER